MNDESERYKEIIKRTEAAKAQNEERTKQITDKINSYKHQGIEIFECKECEYSANSINDIVEHIQTQHKEEDPKNSDERQLNKTKYVCEDCNEEIQDDDQDKAVELMREHADKTGHAHFRTLKIVLEIRRPGDGKGNMG